MVKKAADGVVAVADVPGAHSVHGRPVAVSEPKPTRTHVSRGSQVLFGPVRDRHGVEEAGVHDPELRGGRENSRMEFYSERERERDDDWRLGIAQSSDFGLWVSSCGSLAFRFGGILAGRSSPGRSTSSIKAIRAPSPFRLRVRRTRV